MSRLLRVELDRFASRALIRAGVVAVLVICCFAVVSAWNAAAPPSQAEQDQARVYYEQALTDWEQNGEQYIADCRAQEEADKETADDPGLVDYGCDEMTAPKLQDWIGGAPSFGRDTAALLTSLSLLLVLAPVLLAGSFVSAEFSTGSIANWLTFAPRRVRVYLSKVLAAGLGIIPVAAVGVAIVLGGSWLAYRNFDTINAEASTDLDSPVAVALRLVALTPVVAVLGAALGFLARHTAAVLGVVLGWVVLVEGILVNWVQALRPWTLTLNISAWVSGSAPYWTQECTTTASGRSCQSVEHVLSQTQGAVYLLVVTAVVAGVALLVFRRRDVG
ncbi:ABC transporter permease subunit [Cellulomonas sp.]|uniref:ABC transporter permease subunit n=1 Tax=Cellulomonas sp. TaxID=40001 RepID=UPI003BADA0AA